MTSLVQSGGLGMVVVDLPTKGGFTGQAVAVADGLIPGLVADHYGLTTGLDTVALLHPDWEIPTVAAKAEAAVVVRHRTRAEVARIQYHDGQGLPRKEQLSVSDQASAPTTVQPLGPPAVWVSLSWLGRAK